MWIVKEPSMGDHIRVNRGFYYHHAIYCDNNTIIQFGSNSEELDPSLAAVMVTNIEGFLKGGNLEVRVFTEEELKVKRSNIEIVNYAFTQLGRKGYDLINNNCEHFANECVFGEKRSEQIDMIKNFFSRFKE